jgi:hypothetical protein
MINVTIDFKDKEKFDRLIRYIENNEVYFEAQAAIIDLADSTVSSMHEIIDTSRRRPDAGTHKLENAIDKKILNTTAGVEVGIGEISRLRVEAPYFEVLDVGGYIPNHGNFVPLGAFAPGNPKPDAGSFRDGQWVVGAGKYTFKAKRAIEGIDYIGSAIRELDRKLRETIESLGGKFLTGMSKT